MSPWRNIDFTRLLAVAGGLDERRAESNGRVSPINAKTQQWGLRLMLAAGPVIGTPLLASRGPL